jgi:prepilin-type N-terminal cleavage/methylation domain-containing protein
MRGFTLIEVLISVFILSLVGGSLLSLNKSNLKLLSFKESHIQDYKNLSVIANHLDPKYNHLTKSNYDLIKNSYQIDNREIKEKLQSTKNKISYEKKEIEDIVTYTVESYQINSTTILKVQK